ncbi:MAG: hypothetical protein V7676_16590 [Parasphingorhabdus sp.]|uniref:hypothetical protein n=1 Tax=Parasphingorhabdus sp. TaxID=2709688 RepID=UPI0030010AE9
MHSQETKGFKEIEMHVKWIVKSPLPLAMATLLISAPIAASSSQNENARRANLAFAEGAAIGVSPMTPSEMAQCSAYWDRWKYIVDSSNIPQFNEALRTELSSNNAKKAAARWLKLSKKALRRRSGNLDELAEILGESNEHADAAYANWVNDEMGTAYELPRTLGSC